MIFRVFDLETTGLDPAKDMPIEIGTCDIAPTPNGFVVGETRSTFCNPHKPISPEASAVHHILDEDVKEAPNWPATAHRMLADVSDLATGEQRGAFVAHNLRFDAQWVGENYTKNTTVICTYKASMRLWPDAPSHSNFGLLYWLRPSIFDRTKVAQSHRAGADCYATACVLSCFLVEAEVGDLVKWTKEPILLHRVTFGKHEGKLWRDVDSGYLDWILRQDFDEDVRFTAKSVLKLRRG